MLKNKKTQLFLFFSDIIFIVLSYFAAYFIRLGYINFNYHSDSISDIIYILFLCLVFTLILYVFDFYNLSRIYKTKSNISISITAFISIGFGLGFLFYIFPNLKYGRGIWFLHLILCFFSLTAIRVITFRLLKKIDIRSKVLFLGLPQTNVLKNKILTKNNFINFIGVLSDVKTDFVIGCIADLPKVITLNKVNILVISKNINLDNKIKNFLLQSKIETGLIIMNFSSFHELIFEKIPVDEISTSWFILSSMVGLESKTYRIKIKRILDIFISSVLLFISLPLILTVSIIIKLTSPGPIFYKQTRCGLKNKYFNIYKLRSMRTDAERNGTAVWAKENDNRVTVIGKFIRKTRIDELPQLINILKGDMSFVGPRPERPEFIEELEKEIPFYTFRHVVKPGLTGWAQVKYPYGASIEDAKEKLQYEIYYIKNMNIYLDLKIILKTIRTILFAVGSR